MPERIFKTGQGRVFLQMYGGSPDHPLEYRGRMRMGGFTIPFGDVTPIKEPSMKAYDQFEIVGKIKGEAGLPTTSVSARLSHANELMETPCPLHLQVHYGSCQDPTDLHRGWDLIFDFEGAELSSIEATDLTAISEDQQALVELTASLSATRIQEVRRMMLTERADEAILRTVVKVLVADYISCGDCGYLSDGNQRILAVMQGSGAASPGLPPELIVSINQGRTVMEYDITTLTGDEQPTGLAVAGARVLVPSTAAGSVSYADLTSLDTWAEVTDGFAGVADPIAVFALAATIVWVVGTNGHIWFSESPTSSYEVQEAGTLAAGEDLTCIHACNSQDVLVGGGNGTLLYTNNGGLAWALAPTTPTLDDINCVWMQTTYRWLVGDNAGHLWYTNDAGATWSEITFPGSGTGRVEDIVFARHPAGPFGFLAHTKYDVATGYDGRILRTIDHGNSWYILPEGAGSIPSNNGIYSLSAGVSPNFVVGGGVGEDDEDGILVVGA